MAFIYYYLVVFAVFMVTKTQGVNMPPECEGKSYCTIKPDNYDDSQMNYLTKDMMEPVANEEEMAPTLGDDDNCWFETRVEVPYIIRARINSSVSENRLVAQSSNKYFQQRIKTTRCWDKTKPCFQEIKLMTGNINTTCEERYTTVTLYIFDESEGRIKPQPFDIAVSCYCKIISNYGK